MIKKALQFRFKNATDFMKYNEVLLANISVAELTET